MKLLILAIVIEILRAYKARALGEQRFLAQFTAH
jgi:hypothetical protein